MNIVLLSKREKGAVKCVIMRLPYIDYYVICSVVLYFSLARGALANAWKAAEML